MDWNKPRASKKSTCVHSRGLKRAAGSQTCRIILTALLLTGAICGVVFFMTDFGKVNHADPVDKRKSAADGDKRRFFVRKAKKTVKTARDALDNLGEFEHAQVVQSAPPQPSAEFTPVEWDSLTNRIFHSGTEQVMSWLFTCELGSMPMPMPNLTPDERANLAAVLVSKNVILPADNDHVAYAKSQVDAAKREMVKYIKQGGDPDDFLRYYYEELNRAFEYRCMAVEQIESVAEEDIDLAREVGQKINEKLASEGIKTINIETIIPEGENTSHETE